jgi:hypothetical protein
MCGLPSPQVEGWENLPPPERAVVYVANHQSFLVGLPGIRTPLRRNGGAVPKGASVEALQCTRSPFIVHSP